MRCNLQRPVPNASAYSFRLTKALKRGRDIFQFFMNAIDLKAGASLDCFRVKTFRTSNKPYVLRNAIRTCSDAGRQKRIVFGSGCPKTHQSRSFFGTGHGYGLFAACARLSPAFTPTHAFHKWSNRPSTTGSMEVKSSPVGCCNKATEP